MPPHSKLQSGPLRNHLHFFFFNFYFKGRVREDRHRDLPQKGAFPKWPKLAQF